MGARLIVTFNKFLYTAFIFEKEKYAGNAPTAGAQSILLAVRLRP